MPRRVIIVSGMVLACATCSAKPITMFWDRYQPPDWRKYRATSVSSSESKPAVVTKQTDAADRVTFHDLKTESDRILADRLLGAVGRRITYIDRHRERWADYGGENDAADTIDLYTHPAALGSQFGLCGVERYTLTFDKTGHISTVSMSSRYGVEGPLFQKSDLDWNYYRNAMCLSAPASHAPSYFPATDSIAAHDAAMLLIPLVDLAASKGTLPYRIECRDDANRDCSSRMRTYLGTVRLSDIDDFSLARCQLADKLKEVCFTITTGEGRLGSFPKTITVHGSTYMNNVKVESVDVDEAFTLS